MFVILILILVVSGVVVGGVLITLWRVIRAYHKRQLLAGAHGILCDAPDGVGISLVCSGVHDAAQLDNLLAVEYIRYQVVLALDSQIYGAEFAAITSRYRMIRVNYTGSEELPVTGVRGLYRSSIRSYRRLVLLDRAYTSVYDDFDTATGVTTYEYLLPILGGYHLLPNAIERLAAEMSEHSFGELSMVCSYLGEPARLFSREIVVREGGFSDHLDRAVDKHRIKTLYEPLLYAVRCKCQDYMWVHGVIGVAVAFGVGICLWRGWWPAAVVLLTMAVIGCAVSYAAPIISDGSRLWVNCCTVAKYYIRKYVR